MIAPHRLDRPGNPHPTRAKTTMAMINPLLPAALLLSLLSLLSPTLAGAADTIVISDAYARASGPNARAGAAFMVIANTGAADDRLTGVASAAAARTELHTHTETGDGVMRMRPATDGFAIPAGGRRILARGGDHIMLMGLAGGFGHGDTVTVTLTFERAGDITLAIPVDTERGAQP